MQRDYPERESRETNIPNLGRTAPANSPYTNDEWIALLETPVKIGRAMMAVSPSGMIGTTQELVALRKSYQDAFQNVSNPLLLSIRQQLQNKDTLETLWEDAGHAFGDRWDVPNVRQASILACQQAVTLLKKIPAQDAQVYKDFLYGTALKVAQAAKEGGVLGVGGVAVSADEKALLQDISQALDLRQA